MFWSMNIYEYQRPLFCTLELLSNLPNFCNNYHESWCLARARTQSCTHWPFLLISPDINHLSHINFESYQFWVPISIILPHFMRSTERGKRCTVASSLCFISVLLYHLLLQSRINAFWYLFYDRSCHSIKKLHFVTTAEKTVLDASNRFKEARLQG